MSYPKVLFSIDSKPHDGFEEEISYEDWNDFELVLDFSTQKYKFFVETMLGFGSEDGAKRWMSECLSHLNEWMVKHNFPTDEELDLYDVFTEGININSEFDSIEKAFAAMKFFVRGFNGKGLF